MASGARTDAAGSRSAAGVAVSSAHQDRGTRRAEASAPSWRPAPARCLNLPLRPPGPSGGCQL